MHFGQCPAYIGSVTYHILFKFILAWANENYHGPTPVHRLDLETSGLDNHFILLLNFCGSLFKT